MPKSIINNILQQRARQYCSAAPTKVKLRDFTGSNYKLKDDVWETSIGS